MDKERSTPPADWTTINPEVVNIASMGAMMRHELSVLTAVAIVIPLATFLGFFPLYLAIFIGILYFFGMLLFGWVPFASRKQTKELHRYLSWIFATQAAQERKVLLKPYPIEIAYRPTGKLLIAEVYGEENQLQHEIVVTVPEASTTTGGAELNLSQTAKVHYDPETHEPVVIDCGSFRCWRAPGFASPPDLSLKQSPGSFSWPKTRAMSRLHPTTACVLWVVLFGFFFRFFISPDAFLALNGGGAEKKKWGFIDANGQLVIQPTFDAVKGVGASSQIGPIECRTMKPQKSFHEGMAAVRLGKKWGFIDKSGKLVIQPQYDDVGNFSEGAACVVKDDKCGFVDRSGKIVIPLLLDRLAFDRDLMEFHDGVCVFDPTPYTLNYLDRKGDFLLEEGAMDAAPFSEGMAVIEYASNGTRVIDCSGKVILSIPVKWRDFANVMPAGKFAEGYLRICGYTQSQDPKPRYWFVDKTGTPVGTANYKAANDFSEGLAAVMPMGSEKYGFIDKTGKLVIQPAYETPGEFHDGFAPVRLYHKDKGGENHLWGYIDKKGTWLAEPQFANAQNFSEGKAVVRVGNGLSPKEGYIDKTGKLVIPAKYYNGFPFSEGLAAVEMPVSPSNK